VTRKWSDSVKPEDVPPPVSLHDRRLNTPYVQAHWQVDATDMKHMPLIRARYFQLVQEVDEQVGRILTGLDELGLADRTLVVFTADHGEFLGDHGLAQKFYPYQEAVRVPLIIRLPRRIPERKIVNTPVNLTDVHATILDYLGCSAEGRPNRESRSLRPLIEGRSQRFRTYTFSEMANWHMIVSGDWKYVWFPAPQKPDLLFDLRKDPREINNLLGSSPERGRHLAHARTLRRRMLEWMDEIGHEKRDAFAASEIG